jgi:biopolymer transport protein ExbD
MEPHIPLDQAPSPAQFRSGEGSAEDIERRRKRQAAKAAERRIERGKHEPVEINIVAMMDIFTILLVYLLKSYAADPVQITPSPETQLPLSNTQLSPQEAVQVAITQRVVLVNDKRVATVRDGRIVAEHKKDGNPAQMMVPPLFDALVSEGDRQKMFASYNRSKSELQFKGLLTVIADKRVPFRLLTEVLYTAGQAEYGQYKFAVIKKE